MAGRFTVESIFKAVDRVTAPVSRMQARVSKYTRATQRGLRSVNRAIDGTVSGFVSLTKAAAKYGAIGTGAVTGAVALLVREFSKVENAEAAFTPLLGGAAKAKELVDALNQTAASTPFQFETLADSAGQLLPVMNGDIERTIKTLRMLGDTAGGNAQKLDSITRGFTKAMLKGKVDMEALNMIAEAGVPIFDDLAAVMGKKVNDSFFKMISAGKVTTTQLTAAFEKMTGEGGKFFQGMDIASQTVSGRWSTLMDNISLTAAELGSVLAPTIKELIQQATTIAQRVREWVKQNRALIESKFLEGVEAAKDALLGLVDMYEYLKTNGGTIAKVAGTVLALVLTLKTLSAVMAVVNIVMTANPIGLVVVAIAALIAGIAAAVIWWDEIKAAFLSLPGPVQAAIAVLTGPIGWLIGAAALIRDNWEPISAFFEDLWAGIVAAFSQQIERIMDMVNKVVEVAGKVRAIAGGISDKASELGERAGSAISDAASSTARFFGFGDDQAAADTGQMVSPQERTATVLEDRQVTQRSEVTIRDETGRAERTAGEFGAGVMLTPSGAF